MDKKENKKEVFFPYYINQSRLLDIYAILNGGYSEYSEITTSVTSEKKRASGIDAQANLGFKIVDLGVNVSGDIEHTDTGSDKNHEKKVQTITSILSHVTNILGEQGYLQDIENSHPGDFVCLPVKLQINSIKSVLSEMEDILKLAESMKKLGVPLKNIGADTRQFETILNGIKVLFGGEEILFDTDGFAITGNILDDHLYQSKRSDLINTDLICLAQVKRVFPEGTELMRNTMFSKIKDATAKQKFIEAVQQLSNGNVFDFEATAVPSIHNKPVYQLEIIALYQ